MRPKQFGRRRLSIHVNHQNAANQGQAKSPAGIRAIGFRAFEPFPRPLAWADLFDACGVAGAGNEKGSERFSLKNSSDPLFARLIHGRELGLLGFHHAPGVATTMPMIRSTLTTAAVSTGPLLGQAFFRS
jgi:hypothetical protein